MQSLRELILLIATLTWMVAGSYIFYSVIGQEFAVTEKEKRAAGMGQSPYVFAGGLTAFLFASLFWKKRTQ